MRKETMRITLNEHPLTPFTETVDFRENKEEAVKVGTAESTTKQDVFGLWVDYPLYQDNNGKYFVIEKEMDGYFM